MKWTSAISEQTNLEQAIEECVSEIRSQFADDTPHLALVFVSPDYQSDFDRVPELVRQNLS